MCTTHIVIDKTQNKLQFGVNIIMHCVYILYIMKHQLQYRTIRFQFFINCVG